MSTDSWRLTAIDATVAAVIGAALVVGAASTPQAHPLGYGAAALGALAVLACRPRPVPALAVMTAAMLGYILLVAATPTAAVGVIGAVYFAARSGRRLLAVAASVLFLAGFLAVDLSAVTEVTRETTERTGLLMGWFVAANVFGAVSRHRRAYLAEVERRAAEAERTREETALRRAGQERLRIARELHDSLTHSISIIKLQAGVAVHLARKRGEEEPEALLAIQEASGEAMRELRATLEVLRHPGEQESGHGIEKVDDLAQRAGAAGVAVTVRVEGHRRGLPGVVDRAAYRIVQEALTNVTRHAGAASASVLLDFGEDALTLVVTDDGTAAPGAATEPGTGLVGMRERVGALGGTLDARPRAEGGFLVCAEIPLEPVSAEVS